MGLLGAIGGTARRIARAAAAFRSDSPSVEGRWFRLSWGNPDDQPAGLAINPTTALSLSSYFACINRIATDVSCHPFKVVRREGGRRIDVPDHPVSLIDWIPLDLNGSSDPDAVNGTTSKTRAVASYQSHALSHGGGFLRIRRDGYGEVKALQLLDPSATYARSRKVDGAIYYQSGSKTFREDEILHLAGFGFDGLNGYSVARLARDDIAHGKAVNIYGARFFGSGGQPKAVLESPHTLKPEAIKNLRESWDSVHGGPSNSHKIAILEQDLKYKPISIPPEDAQFLQSRQFQVVEIARWFNVPPHKIGDYSQMQLASAAVEQANLDYLVAVVLPWLTRMADEWNRKLFTVEERAAGFEVEFDLRWLLRIDSKSRAEYNREALSWGWETRNEVRAREGLNPVDGGDSLLVPLNFTTLEAALAGPPPPNEPAPRVDA